MVPSLRIQTIVALMKWAHGHVCMPLRACHVQSLHASQGRTRPLWLSPLSVCLCVRVRVCVQSIQATHALTPYGDAVWCHASAWCTSMDAWRTQLHLTAQCSVLQYLWCSTVGTYVP